MLKRGLTKSIVINIMLITDEKSEIFLRYVINKKIITKERMKKMKRKEEVEKMLIVVDMVNGFVKEGAMATPYMEKLIPEIERLIEDFNSKNEGVMFVKESHDESCTEFDKFPAHCIRGTYEAEIIDEFTKYLDDSFIFEKNSTSAIFAPNFIETINEMNNLKEVIITGGCTDICSMNIALPLANYFDQVNRDVKVILPKNANDTYDAPNHNRNEYNDMAYKFMKQAGINVVDKYIDDEKLNNTKRKEYKKI